MDNMINGLSLFFKIKIICLILILINYREIFKGKSIMKDNFINFQESLFVK